MKEHSARTFRQDGIYDGVFLVDKPSGPTSHDVVAIIRRRFGFDKVGHGGTLDPQATGILVILIERGTKLSDYFLTSDKTYEGVMHFGVTTDSQDAQGKIIREADCGFLTRELVEAAMKEYTGDIMQTPPMVSAAKQAGVPLYKLARKGKTVERKAKLINVYEFKMLDFSPPRVSFILRCTKGTYVRTICSDVGDKLGCGAYLEQLRRTRSGDMDITQTVPLDQVMAMSRDQLLERTIPLHRFIAARRMVRPAHENTR